MAMTKVERERVAQLENEVRMARALRWPSGSAPIPVDRGDCFKRHQDTGEVTPGWFYNIHNNWAVTHGCCDGHNYSPNNHTKTDRRIDGNYPRFAMYATKLDALRAMRMTLTIQFAGQLAELDKRIEEADRA